MRKLCSQRGQAALSDLQVTTSSEALLAGKAPTFRLLVWAVDMHGEPVASVTYVVSEFFVVGAWVAADSAAAGAGCVAAVFDIMVGLLSNRVAGGHKACQTCHQVRHPISCRSCLQTGAHWQGRARLVPVVSSLGIAALQNGADCVESQYLRFH